MNVDGSAGCTGSHALNLRGWGGRPAIFPRSDRPSFRRYTLSTVAVAALLACSSPVLAAPQGGTVASGTAAISSSGTTTNIDQSTGKAIINWQSFSVGSAETVNFNQPSVSAVTLNRVIGNEQSVINGALNANGKVFLVNSAGVLIGKGASVNTAGFVASTLDITNDDFNAGNYVFRGSSSTGVINLGTITATDGGYVVLMGKTVSNQGVIVATKGTVALAGGDQITLNFNGDSLLSVSVDQGTLDALVENRQAIYADGGKVILTAKAADDLLSAQVNNDGLIQARTIGDLKGDISLYAHGGTTTVAGTLDASAPNGGDGGAIETSGDKVKIADSAVVTTKAATGKTGTWLIDPDGFTIGTGGDMTGTALTNALVNNSMTISSTSGSGSDGNINVNEAVSWSANTLTLNATHNIYVNAAMTATGTASLAANYGTGTNADGTPYGLYTLQSSSAGTFAGQIYFSGSGAVIINSQLYTVINTAADLQTAIDTVNADTSIPRYYVLGATFSPASDIGAGSSFNGFTGVFNGLGHVIQTRNNYYQGTGLFATISEGSVVSNLGLTYAQVAETSVATSAVGILANVNHGDVINDFVSAGSTIYYFKNGSITVVGGLVGENYGLIAQSYYMGYIYEDAVSAALSATVTNQIIGGLVGINEAGGSILDSSSRSVSSSYYIYSSSSNSSIKYAGGLVGENFGTIERSYTGLPTTLSSTTGSVGAFVGLNGSTGTIDQCYAYDSYAAKYYKAPFLAGFVWENDGTITNSYTTALSTSASANQTWNAGFVGVNTGTGTISNSYATEYSNANTANTARYGFVETNTGTITNADWYATYASGGVTVSDSATGVTQLTSPTTSSLYDGFSSSDWALSASGLPILKNILIYVTSSGVTYGTAISAATLGLTVTGLQGGDTASNLLASTDSGYVDAGIWDAESLLSGSTYTNIKGLVTVKPKALTAVITEKTYDGTTAATVSGWSGLVNGQTLDVVSSASFGDANAGTGKAVTLSGITISDGTGKASNYTINSSATGAIDKATLTAIVTAANKTYDGTTTDAASVALSGLVSSDSGSVAASGTAAFASANAGTWTVTVSGITLSGSAASNYTVASTTATTTATINPLVVQLTGIKADDGKTTDSATNLSVANIVSGDTLTLSGAVSVASTATGFVGYAAISDVSGLTLGGSSASNYSMTGATGSVAVGPVNLVLSNIVKGTASITSSGTTTTVTTSDKAIINWLEFNVLSGTTVKFVEPNASSVVLNRVTSGLTTSILGTLTANGRVFIVNSNGIVFGSGSSVNVAGLVASTLDISDSNFNSGNYLFTLASGSGSVVNQGDIIISDGGFAVLVSGGGVSESGSLTVGGGKALFVSADNLTLALDSSGLGLNTYAIANPAGTTEVSGVVNVSLTGGTGGLVEMAGSSVSYAADWTPTTGSDGTWSLSLPTISIGNGGTFSSDYVESNLATRNFKLNALSGDLTVNDAITWDADTTLTLSATNNITINKSITATGASAGLVMNYGGNYNILTPATYSGVVLDASGMPLLDANGKPIANTAPAGTEYASITLSGSNASLAMNGNVYTLIHSMSQLDSLDGYNSITGKYYDPANGSYDLTTAAYNSVTGKYYDVVTGLYDLSSSGPSPLIGYYALAQDLSATGITYTSAPIGTLSGTLAGLGHTISDLTVNDTAGNGNAALIGTLNGGGASLATIRDLGLVDVTITSASASSYDGALVGSSNHGTINNVYVKNGTVSSLGQYIGGLVGSNSGGAITDASLENVTVSGLAYIGGLAGSSSGTITDSSVNATVSAAMGSAGQGSNDIGGVVGSNSGTISGVWYNTVVNTDNSQDVGGVVGYNTGTINGVGGFTYMKISWSATNGTDGQYYGGVIGNNQGGTLENFNVQGSMAVTQSGVYLIYDVGGAVGYNWNGTVAHGNTGVDLTTSGGVYDIGAGVGLNWGGNVSDVHGSGQGFSEAIGSNVGNGQVTGNTYVDPSSGNGNNGNGGNGNNGNGGNDDSSSGGNEDTAVALQARGEDAVSTGSGIVSAVQAQPGMSVAVMTMVGPFHPDRAVSDNISFNDTASYSADIKSIEVNGVRYNLDDGGPTGGNSGGGGGEKSDDDQKNK
ncbi:filamentous hemagglutinin N-terminal domain-containing protein [Telmatospirillum siberiense]|nr:filamentous hemagglutinin N-terminal domain-containing protein [Telmatospirillum siberiense]